MMNGKHKNPDWIIYTDPKTSKTLTVPPGYLSDGATGGFDVCPPSFYAHDWGCGNYFGDGPKPVGGEWDDGTKITNWQLSTLHSNMLLECAKKKDRTLTRKLLLNSMAIWRWPATFLFGGGVARKNGMLKLKKV